MIWDGVATPLSWGSAWADALSWQGVIPLLQREGFRVVAVENALTSFADDVATTRRMIDAQPGPVVGGEDLGDDVDLPLTGADQLQGLGR